MVCISTMSAVSNLPFMRRHKNVEKQVSFGAENAIKSIKRVFSIAMHGRTERDQV